MRPEYVFVGIGIVCFSVGLPLAGRRIPPNRWYGVRLRATFADESIWYETNALAGRDLVVLGVLFVALTMALLDRVPTATYVLWCGPVLVLGSIVAMVRSVRLANRLWRERGNDPGSAATSAKR